MDKISRIVSMIFSPLMAPTYGVALALNMTALVGVPLAVRFGVISVTFIITCVVPLFAFFGLSVLGLIKDHGLNDSRERTVPYIITLVSYIACSVYLIKANAPMWLVSFIFGAILAIFVCMIVNLRWKISGHMTGMGGLMAMVMCIAVSRYALFDMIWVAMAAVLASGLVAMARLGLQRHTLWQVVAGTANGFICVSVMSWLVTLF